MYCFVAGHCNNTEVTEATTQVEASAICDKLYGQRQGMIGNDRCPKTKDLRSYEVSWVVEQEF